MKDNKVYYIALTEEMEDLYIEGRYYELYKAYSTGTYLEYRVHENVHDMAIIQTDSFKKLRFFECVIGDRCVSIKSSNWDALPLFIMTNSITLTKEIPFEAVDKAIKDNINTIIDGHWSQTKWVATNGYGLNILINDWNEDVRTAAQKAMAVK